MPTSLPVSRFVLVVLVLTIGGAHTTQLPAQPGKVAGEERSDNGLKMKLCWCPAGTFTMGSPRSEKDRFSNEEQVDVTFTQGFWLGKTEVTQGEWTQLMRTESWKDKNGVKAGRDYAASHVNWNDVTEFCRKLTSQEQTAGRLPSGWTYKLPTEAQWEYACRAGTTTPFSFGADELQLGDYAWYDKNSKDIGERYTHGVGLKKPNAWGLHDMHGNVFEWCQDWYADKLPGGRNPEVSTESSYRVYRGGTWYGAADFCRSAKRVGELPGMRFVNVGFRVVCIPPGQ